MHSVIRRTSGRAGLRRAAQSRSGSGYGRATNREMHNEGRNPEVGARVDARRSHPSGFTETSSANEQFLMNTLSDCHRIGMWDAN